MNKQKKSHKGLIITLSCIAGFLAMVVAAFFIYVSIYYHPTDNALTYLGDSTLSTVVEKDDCITFQPKANQLVDDVSVTHEGFIFYPGGKVDYRAYVPTMRDLSDKGITCILLKMPFNLAVLNINAAAEKQNLFPKVTNWYIGGHSLGGAMASVYLSNHTSEYKGLILEGAYSTVDLSSYTNLSTLAFLASNDKVMNAEKYAKDKANLPNLTEYTIDGGIHSYYGDYGLQSGDGEATISCEEQRNQIVTAISLFVYGKTILG